MSTYRLLDVNGDGALDIITGAGESASRLTGRSTIFLNDGHGVFSGWIPQTTERSDVGDASHGGYGLRLGR